MTIGPHVINMATNQVNVTLRDDGYFEIIIIHPSNALRFIFGELLDTLLMSKLCNERKLMVENPFLRKQIGIMIQKKMFNIDEVFPSEKQLLVISFEHYLLMNHCTLQIPKSSFNSSLDIESKCVTVQAVYEHLNAQIIQLQNNSVHNLKRFPILQIKNDLIRPLHTMHNEFTEKTTMYSWLPDDEYVSNECSYTIQNKTWTRVPLLTSYAESIKYPHVICHGSNIYVSYSFDCKLAQGSSYADWMSAVLIQKKIILGRIENTEIHAMSNTIPLQLCLKSEDEKEAFIMLMSYILIDEGEVTLNVTQCFVNGETSNKVECVYKEFKKPPKVWFAHSIKSKVKVFCEMKSL